ncbi:uncharacterized protein LOC144143453 [Haemaphysalis longicornis]
MFSVIHFTASDEVAVVPSSWVENDEAHWPGFKSTSKVNAAIRSQAAPSKDWEQFPCRVLSTTDNYEVARQRSIRAEDNSDLTSDPEQSQTRVRRPPKPHEDFVEESSEESIDESTSDPLDTHCTQFVNHPPKPRHSRSSKVSDPRRKAEGSGFPDAIKPGRPQSASTLSANPHPPENVLITVLRELESLKAELKTQSRTLAKIEERMAAQAPTALADTALPEDLPLYPATTEDELATLNASLEDAAIFSAMVKVLGQTGGSNVPSTTKRVFKKLVADEVAVLYSWTGRKGKKRAEKLKIISLVFAAVRVTQKATDDTLGHIIGDWLRFANVRLMATQKRKPVDGDSSETH